MKRRTREQRVADFIAAHESDAEPDPILRMLSDTIERELAQGVDRMIEQVDKDVGVFERAREIVGPLEDVAGAQHQTLDLAGLVISAVLEPITKRATAIAMLRKRLRRLGRPTEPTN